MKSGSPAGTLSALPNEKGGNSTKPFGLVQKVMPKLKLHSREDIRLAIHRRGNEIASQLSDKAIFQSPEFNRYATKLVDFILRKKKFFRLTLLHDESENSVTAFTDGRSITANTGNILVKAAKGLEKRFQSAMGLIFHEAAHMLFMNFDLTFSALEQIRKGSLYGNFPTNREPALFSAYQELCQTMATHSTAIAQLYQELMNTVNDGHDEATIQRCFPGFIADCITTMDDVQWEVSPSLNDAISAGATTLDIYAKLLLEYSLFRKYKISERTPQVEDYLASMKEMEQTLDRALAEDDAATRWDWINLLVLQLWPFIRDLFPPLPEENRNQDGNENQEESQESDDSGNGGGQCKAPTLSPDELAQLIQEVFAGNLEEHGVSPCPVNGSGTGMYDGSIQPPATIAGSEFDVHRLAREIADRIAGDCVQRELDDAQMDAIRNADCPLIHRRISLDVHRHFQPEKERYDAIVRRVKPYLKSLIQSTQLLVDELNDDYTQKHRRIGPIVQATDAYRPDGAFFAKRKIPDDVPDMAICILVDVSASMAGRKLDYSTEAAILMERFANAMNIPIMIAAHNVTIKDRVNLHIYTDFVSTAPDNDRYALAGISARGRNRDGYPLRVCCELLAKRPEEVKLMVVLSDGAPNDGPGYKGAAAREDIKGIVREFRRKGLLIFGAAIDKDREVIESIYGDHFLSIDNLASMPKTMIRIIKHHMT